MVLLKLASLYLCSNNPHASTFQYGSIKIKDDLVANGCVFSLHSTMVLLKYAFFYVDSDNFKISTFHYGSIKISMKSTYKKCISNLHSTMVLLKLRELRLME